MAIGEKIQLLRKMNKLSQEQLAEKLDVSRQAISKWELNESTPDTEKIILLSRVFQVSTDYLLHDDVNNDMEIPAVKTSSERLRKQYGLRTSFIITTGIIIVGLLISIVAQFTWQTIFSVSIGLIIQIIGVIVFEKMSSRYITENGNKEVHKSFYVLNVWFILPFPMIFLSDLFFSIYPRPRSYRIGLLFTVIMYVIFCSIITFVLKKKLKNSK